LYSSFNKKSGLKVVVGYNAPIGEGDKLGLTTDICPNNIDRSKNGDINNNFFIIFSLF